jgi:hypothetical protein
MQRITKAIKALKYSIHDLSRCCGEGDHNLARFNMPLELGICMAQRFGIEDEARRHDWLVLVPRGHDYRRFISDLAGYDPKEYDGSKESVISAVMSWLATRPDAVWTPTPKDVIDALNDYGHEKSRIEVEWAGAQVPWSRVVSVGMQVATAISLIPK